MAGFTLFGASWKDGALSLSDKMANTLPLVHFTWTQGSHDKRASPTNERVAAVPVYSNQRRDNFLFEVRCECPPEVDAKVWAQRGVCMATWYPYQV